MLPWKHGYNANCQQDLRESYCFCIYFNYTTVNSIAIRTFNNTMSGCLIEAHFGERLKAIKHGEQPFSIPLYFIIVKNSCQRCQEFIGGMVAYLLRFSRIHWWYGRWNILSYMKRLKLIFVQVKKKNERPCKIKIRIFWRILHRVWVKQTLDWN